MSIQLSNNLHQMLAQQLQRHGIQVEPIARQEEEESVKEPEYGSLTLSNHPNPFNPVTLIRYSVPEQTHVRLEVFNILGQRVALLVDEVRNAGSYEVSFDGARLSSGVYIYRLHTESHTETRQMMLAK